MEGLFVTGTDTGVGKTLFSAALLLRLGEANVRAAACKPVSAGCRRESGRLVNADAELLNWAAPLGQPLEVVNPVSLEPAVAPHIAARDAGMRLDAAGLAAACRRAGSVAEFLVVEGAGGWRVPLHAPATMADLARELGLPVVLVVGMKLGCLNHALLSAEAIERDGLPLAGWVANTLALEMDRLRENITTLADLLPCPLLAEIPVLSGTSERARAREAARVLPPHGMGGLSWQ
jgi:dethiobiotin synthetase